MFRTPPIAITTTHLADHPAVRAWGDLGGPVPERVVHLREESRSKPAVYRLVFAEPGRPALFAKRMRAAGLASERRVYEAILPRLPLTSPRLHSACVDRDGLTWLFIEDVGDRCLNPANPEHRVLAARWLGLLHSSAAALVESVPLPSAGPARYLAHLRAARGEIRRNLGNRALNGADRAVLDAVLAQGEAVEASWPRIEEACLGFPATLVHADLQPKNLRIRVTDQGSTLYPIDWEMAGWGVPAADLARASDRGLTLPFDLDTYAAIVGARWPELDAAAIRRLSILGHLFQSLAGIAWSCADLRFESPRCLVRPIGSMRVYVAKIKQALEESTEWLG